MKRKQLSVFGLLALLLLTITTACAQAYVRTAEGFRLGIVDNGRSRISAQLSRHEDGYWIEGTVHRKPLVHGPMTGHIHVEVRSAEGALFTTMDVPLEPASIPSGARRDANFAARLPDDLPPDAVVTVRHRGDEGVRRFRETPASRM